MIKEFIGTGSTIEQATQNAKIGLNAPLSADVKIEVLAMPKKKILGLFGGSDAQVKASYDDGVKEKKAPKKSAPKAEKKPETTKAPAKKAPKAKNEVAQTKTTTTTTPAPAKEKKADSPESVDLEYAKSYVLSIVKGLNIDDAKVSASYENGVITMEIECDDYGIIIGRRGDTLDSIQYLTSLAMKKITNGYVRVNLNVGNYREKRNDILKALAKKNASYVLRTGKRYTFEPMNPYERRIIHTTVQEIDGVESRSIGYNQDRRVVLEPTGGVKPRQNYRNNRQARPQSTTSANAQPRADRADLPKFGKIEVKKD